MDDLKLVRIIIDILQDNMPEDCAEIMEKYYEMILKDIKDRGLNYTLRKWFYKDDEEVLLIQ
ncbi:hypothetical protein [Acidianus brierleyi]|uniref:Uncharacterized protein n=1 Tax=Acidianus brierleyi TaxID=41673 RepID=A0A2U9IGF4_9CREN|nr:hypothetical protein [Acidianus brierleyi]AWR95090.1 hypothetical protein DFR85_11270 [Acidianus brierleyi]